MIIILTFIAFTGLVALISWYKTKEENLSTKEGYFLAGRGLTGLVIAGSLEMTNLSTEQLVGQAGQSYSTNMGAMSWSVNASIALLALALIFLPKYLKAGITTIPEFLEVRFDRTTKQIISFLFLLGYMLTYLPTVLYSGALAFNQIFHLDQLFGITSYQSIAILCVAIGVIGSIYAIFGGLKAIALSDSINGLGLIVGGLLVPVFGFMFLSGQLGGDGSFVDGFDKFLHTNPSYLNAINEVNTPEPWLPWPLLFTGLLVNNMYYWATNQSIIQRSLGGKNLAESQKGAIWAGFFKCLDVFVIVLPGIIAFQLLAAGGQMDTSVGMAADQAYPLLVMEVLPKPLMGFFAAVMFGAILSSFNSVLNSASTIFTLNVWQPIWGKQASNNKVVKVGQIFGTIVGVVSIAIAPFVMFFGTGIMNFINECWGFFSMPLLTAVLFGLLSKKAPAIAPKIVIPVHIVLYGLTKVIPFFSQFHYLYVVFALFVLECIIYAICIKVSPRQLAWEMPDAKVMDMTPWKNGKVWAIAGAAVVAIMYLIFSPLGIGA